MKCIGHYGMQKLVDGGDLAPHGGNNKRQVNCKVCGKVVFKDLGHKWLWFWYDGEEERSTYMFLCGMCQAYWTTYLGYPDMDLDLIDQYKIAFNIKGKMSYA